MIRKNYIAIIFIALIIGITACSGKSNLEPPAPLVSFKQTLKVKKLWSASTGSSARKKFLKLEPAIDGKAVYAAGAGGRLTAFNRTKGGKIWGINTNHKITGAVGMDERQLYIGTKNGKVIAYTKKDGKEVWQSRVTSEILAAPVARGGLVVVQTIDGRIHGMSASNGRRIWVRNWNVPALTLRGTSRPILVQNLVISGLANGKVVALEGRSGRIVREFVVAFPKGNNEIDRLIDVDGSPVVIGDKIIAAGYHGNIIAIDLRQGRLLWKRKMSVYSGIDGDRENVYTSNEEGYVTALHHDTGSVIWVQKKLRARRLSAPIVMDDYIVVGDLKGYLHWMSRTDGRFVARQKVSGSAIKSRMLVQGQVLYINDQGGTITAVSIN